MAEHLDVMKRFHAAVADAALPFYANRPLSILRNTHGTDTFFQKHFLEKSAAGLRVVQDACLMVEHARRKR